MQKYTSLKVQNVHNPYISLLINLEIMAGADEPISDSEKVRIVEIFQALSHVLMLNFLDSGENFV